MPHLGHYKFDVYLEIEIKQQKYRQRLGSI